MAVKVNDSGATVAKADAPIAVKVDELMHWIGKKRPARLWVGQRTRSQFLDTKKKDAPPALTLTPSRNSTVLLKKNPMTPTAGTQCTMERRG